MKFVWNLTERVKYFKWNYATLYWINFVKFDRKLDFTYVIRDWTLSIFLNLFASDKFQYNLGPRGTKSTPSNLDKWARVLLMMPKGETVAQFLHCLATLECMYVSFDAFKMNQLEWVALCTSSNDYSANINTKGQVL